jgi:tripartite-type tricarboxylate transporter receptor subunit TctC
MLKADRRRILLAGACALALTPVLPGTAMAEADFTGETVRIVYNAGPGGATGLFAQILAQHIGRHLPGQPEVIAEPMPGGALLRGIQHVYHSEPDGLTLGWLAWGGATRVLDPEALRVPFGEFGLAGGLGNTWVVHAATELGIEDAADFAGLESVRYGGFTPGASEIRVAASMDLLGIDMHFVGGFQGGAETMAAMQRGEIDLRNGTVSNWLTSVVPEMVETGQSVGLFYWGRPAADGSEATDAELPSLPTFYDYVVNVRGEAPSGPSYDLVRYLSTAADGMTWIFVTPPETSDEITDAVARAYEAVMQDPEMLAAAQNVLGSQPDVVLAEEAAQIMDVVETVSPEVLALMQSYIDQLTR